MTGKASTTEEVRAALPAVQEAVRLIIAARIAAGESIASGPPSDFSRSARMQKLCEQFPDGMAEIVLGNDAGDAIDDAGNQNLTGEASHRKSAA